MIYYFSGTGNSYYAAKVLADGLGEDLMDIAAAVRNGQYAYTLAEGERLGFVFPVYAWAPPKIVTDFVRNLELYYIGEPYLFAVCTCGGAAGNAMDIFENALHKNGLPLDSGFSLVMPDNCITLFDTDSEELTAEKLETAERTLSYILRAVRLNMSGFFRVKKGKMPAFYSRIVNPLFSLGGMRTKSFWTSEQCISCGLCAKVCTADCIKMQNGRPVWTKKTCNMCLACINRCPAQALQYGKKTADRGRYIHPIYQTERIGDS